MKNAVLALKGLSKSFGATRAVDALSFAVGPGEIYGLIGPNGSGKTTTMKMIAGIYRPTSGRVSVRGIDALAAPTKAKRLLAYVPDDPAAYDMLTGREFLGLVGELFDVPRAERDARVASLMTAYRLDPVADGLFAHYSRGTRQKFAIVAALMHQPALMLVDEPMVGLDPESAKVTKMLFKDFVRDGGAILLSTHTLTVADEICDRFGVLKGGRLVAEGTHAELASKAGGDGTLEDVYLKLTGV